MKIHLVEKIKDTKSFCGMDVTKESVTTIAEDSTCDVCLEIADQM